MAEQLNKDTEDVHTKYRSRKWIAVVWVLVIETIGLLAVVISGFTGHSLPDGFMAYMGVGMGAVVTYIGAQAYQNIQYKKTETPQ